MIFKKKKNPVLKNYIINNEKRIIKNHKHVLTVFYLLLCQAVAKNKEFGQTKKEKTELYNDVSIFELTSYVLHNLIQYCLKNHSDKTLMYSVSASQKRRFDLFELLKQFHTDSQKEKKGWNDLSKLYDNRIRFYDNVQNIELKHRIFFTAIKKSTEFDKPIDKIKEIDYNPTDIGITEFLNLSIQLKEY